MFKSNRVENQFIYFLMTEVYGFYAATFKSWFGKYHFFFKEDYYDVDGDECDIYFMFKEPWIRFTKPEIYLIVDSSRFGDIINFLPPNISEFFVLDMTETNEEGDMIRIYVLRDDAFERFETKYLTTQ